MYLKPYEPDIDFDLVYNLFLSSPTYFINVEGSRPDLNMIQSEIASQPTRRSKNYTKQMFLFKNADEALGFCDLHVHHPKENIFYIGIFLISENRWGRGLGKKYYQLLENHVTSQFDCSEIRLGVSAHNNVAPFWQKMGYQANGNTYKWFGQNKTNTVVEYNKYFS